MQLLSCGHVLPVVDYVAQCTEMESLDQSHIRHFVAEVHVTMYTYTSAINNNIMQIRIKCTRLVRSHP